MTSKRVLTGVFMLFVLATLAACGGGGGGGGGGGQPAAAITVQPIDQSVVVGMAATFSVEGINAIGYQWQLSVDGGTTFTDVAGATGASFTTAATLLSDSGTRYRVVVSGVSNSVTSSVATLTVSLAPVAPGITTQPSDITIADGQNAQFTVAVSGTPTPTLQWQLSIDSGGNWNNLGGATGATLTVINVALTSNGWQYRALASNSEGAVNSNAAVLTVRSRTWGTGVSIETADVVVADAGDAINPQVVFDANGNALAVWQQSDGTRYDIWANRYVAATGLWGAAARIETSADAAYSPQIAIDANGNALAVWQQSSNIWASRYTANTGWGTPVKIQTGTDYAYGVQIAIDANGNALAVWIQIDTAVHIWANRYTANTGWGTATTIETNNADNADYPQIAFDANGNAMAVWSQSTAAVGSIWANRYTANSGWGVATTIESGAGDAYGPQIAVDASGNALVVWSQTNGTVYSAWANRYSAGQWGSAALIETNDTDSVGGPRIAIDASGNAIAVWSQKSGATNGLWANRYATGAGWETAVVISTYDGSYADYPQIAFDANGNAMAVWNQYRVHAYNRYINGTGWGLAARVEPVYHNDPTGGAAIAVDPNGNALAVWAQHDGTRYNIITHRYE